ncbi:MAG: hypothetical protein DRQ40_11045, partial [Gammaproteobacteria bacterium]
SRSELWVEENKELALKSLDKAHASLTEAWDSADQMTRTRITETKLQIEQAKKLIQEESQDAEAELQAIANRSESTLNAVLVQARAKSIVLKDEAATRYALVQAKAAELKARIALEVDQSPEKAEQALKEAEDALQRAKETASTAMVEKIKQLQKQTQDVRQAVLNESDEAKAQISVLVESTEERIQAYGKNIQESDEVILLKKRYGQLEAQAALLKVKLAIKADATGKQAVNYLDESKAWYESLKSNVSQEWHKELSELSVLIEETKQAVQRKDKQARAKLAELLKRAAEQVNSEESAP